MRMPMPWFIPIGFGLGLAGTRTAVLLHKAWGQGRRRDIAALVILAWAPAITWILVALFDISE